MDSSQQQMNAALNQMSAGMRAESAAEEAKEMARLHEKGIIVQVVDTSAKPIIGEQRTRYMVKRIAHDYNITLDEASQEERKFLMGAKEPQNITLPIGPAIKYEAEITTIGGDKVNRISYVVADGHNSYILRFISTNNPTAIQQVGDEVAKTWRIKPGKD